MQRRRLLESALGAAALGLAATSRAADKFPDKTITLIVPFAPGGNLDIVGRTVAPGMGAALGQSIVVENRAGAGGAIGASFVARAKPDGYTLMVSTPNALVVSPLITSTTYKLESFAAIGSASTTPLTIVVPAKSRFTSIKALLEAARAKPGKLSVGHSGNGTTNHVALLQLSQAAGLQFNIVPYKGSGPALTDLMAGQLDFVVDQLTSSANFIRAGNLRCLAVMSRERDPALPDVPTLREAGIVDFDASTQAGLLAPAGTPPAVLEVLNAALQKTLADPATAKALLELGSPAHPSTTQEWAATLKHEQATALALSKAGILRGE